MEYPIEIKRNILDKECALAEEFFAEHPQEVKLGRTAKQDWSASSLFLHAKELTSLYFVFYQIQGQIYAVDPQLYLGTGSLGSVKVGFDKKGKSYAIKVKLEDQDVDDQIETEILNILGRGFGVEVRNWVSPVQSKFGQAQSSLKTKYMVTQYVPGIDLAKYLQALARNNQTLEAKVAWNIANNCAKVIKALHAKRIVHADISARNFIIDEKKEGQSIDIVDFGLARQLPNSQDHLDVAIEKMSGIPEWVEGFLHEDKFYRYNIAVDIYLLGKMFIHDLGLSDPVFDEMCAVDIEARPSLADVLAVLKTPKK